MNDKGNFWQLVLQILIVSIHYTAGAERDFFAHVGTTAALPCRVDTKQCGALHSVKWYRDTSRIYVFSHAGGIARAEGDSIDRMTVEYSESSTAAILKISPVEVEDEATYKCEITYLEVRENCDVVQIVKLTTLVKPESIRILGNDGISLSNSSVIGPRNEGTDIEIICEATGGKPIPKITWYNHSAELAWASYTRIEDSNGVGTGRSQLKLTLTKGDLNARFECHVDSRALDEPIVSWVGADVHVRPASMEISGVKSHVVAGTIVLLICDVFGARPAADVKWFNGSTPVDEKLFESEPDDDRNGTFTTRSSLKFTASRYENGKTFHCYAENAVTRGNKEPALHGNLILEVLYPPVISVSPTNITVLESNNSFLQCNYVANPQELQGVLWTKDGKNITLDNRFEGGSIRHPPLRIKNISREDRGEYVCWLKNAVGIGKSDETLLLNVLYPPNVEVIMDPSTPVKAVDRVNVTLYCNVTLGNPSNLTKVRWFLGGDVLKELPECNYTMDDDGGSFCSIDPSILYLEKSQESFAGNYTCQGMNTAGWGPESEPQELIVYYPPSPAKLRYYPSKVIKKASVTLECSVDNPGRPSNISYAWYRGSHLMNDITTSNYTISPVTLETRSNFTCIAVNEGGQSLPATNSINVDAPPSFIQNLPPYQGILSTSKNISLTCRVECWPICSILWLKDGRRLDTNNNPLYHVNTNVYKSELRKNDFESVESTLVWNMTAWPGKELDRSAPNSNYTCQSDGNVVGLGVNSTTEIAVDYAPEEVRILYQNANTSENISVIEGQSPDPVKCVGKGHPALTFVWTKKDSKEPPIKSDQLQLPPLSRHDPGDYVCLASNKHGNETLNVHFNVQYIPECTITKNNDKTTPALVCTSTANPQEVSFTWKIQEQNDTAVESVNIIQDDQQCYLYLDTNINVARTYYCFVNNSVGTSSSCEIKVDASMSWVDEIKENNKTIIIVGASIALILCFLVLCIIIIILCRRKRENTKSPNQSSMTDKARLGAAPPIGYTADPSQDPNRGFYENLPFHSMQNPPNKPFLPVNGDLDYADVDDQYGPINYKAASIYAAMKRKKNKLEEANKTNGGLVMN